jgi:hypothetical protein
MRKKDLKSLTKIRDNFVAMKRQAPPHLASKIEFEIAKLNIMIRKLQVKDYYNSQPVIVPKKPRTDNIRTVSINCQVVFGD